MPDKPDSSVPTPPALPVKKDGAGGEKHDPSTADTDEFPVAVPDFSAEFGDTEKKTPSDWQKLCARYCAGAQGYMKALMRELLTAEDAEGRKEVLRRMKVITDKLKTLRVDVGNMLQERAAINSEIKVAEAAVDQDFRQAAQAVNKEAETPTLSADSPALGDVKTLIAHSKRAHGTASVLHPRFPEVIALQERRKAAKRRAAQQADAEAIPAHHAQTIDVDELTLKPADDQVVATDESELGPGDELLPATEEEAAALEAQTLTTATKPTAESWGKWTGRWAGNLASFGIAPAVRAWLRSRAQKQAATGQSDAE